jgi:hypothetical protein
VRRGEKEKEEKKKKGDMREKKVEDNIYIGRILVSFEQ